MARGDFEYIPVNHQFTDDSPTLGVSFPVQVGQGNVMPDEGYLLITVRGVSSENHSITINDIEMTGWDIPLPPGGSNAWFTYMDRIGPRVLRRGENDLRITRVGDDDFEVKDVVVHWREREP